MDILELIIEKKRIPSLMCNECSKEIKDGIFIKAIEHAFEGSSHDISSHDIGRGRYNYHIKCIMDEDSKVERCISIHNELAKIVNHNIKVLETLKDKNIEKILKKMDAKKISKYNMISRRDGHKLT